MAACSQRKQSLKPWGGSLAPRVRLAGAVVESRFVLLGASAGRSQSDRILRSPRSPGCAKRTGRTGKMAMASCARPSYSSLLSPHRWPLVTRGDLRTHWPLRGLRTFRKSVASVESSQTGHIWGYDYGQASQARGRGDGRSQESRHPGQAPAGGSAGPQGPRHCLPRPPVNRGIPVAKDGKCRLARPRVEATALSKL